jgi:hypothetical protein
MATETVSVTELNMITALTFDKAPSQVGQRSMLIDARQGMARRCRAMASRLRSEGTLGSECGPDPSREKKSLQLRYINPKCGVMIYGDSCRGEP